MVSVWVFGEAAFGALLIQSHAEGSDEKRELSLKILRPTFIVSTLALYHLTDQKSHHSSRERLRPNVNSPKKNIAYSSAPVNP